MAGPAIDRPLTPRRAATRERLLDAAWRVFAERGIQGATVEDICEAAGFTRGAFYSNFQTKDQLFLALMRAEEERVLVRLADLVAEEVPAPAPQGFAVVDSLLERFLAGYPIDRRWMLLHAEFWLHAVRTPEVREELNRSTDRFRDELLDVVGYALIRAGLRLTVDPHVAMQALLAVVEGAAREAQVRGEDEGAEVVDRAVLGAMLRAFTGPA